MPNAEPPDPTEADLEALLKITDEQATLGALQDLLEKLRGKTQEEQPQILFDALIEVRLMERVRGVAYLRARGVDAIKAAESAERAGHAGIGNSARLIARTAADLATLLMQPPGEACEACHGARTVPARVQLAGGAPTRVPCPKCAQSEPTSRPEGG